MTNSVTAAEAALLRDREHRMRAALYSLLSDLKDFVEVVPRCEQERMPEHAIVWMTGINSGPGPAIESALKSHPELWLHALPEDVFLVSRRALKHVLKQVGFGDDVSEFLGAEGEAIVAAHATSYLHELEERKGRKRK